MKKNLLKRIELSHVLMNIFMLVCIFGQRICVSSFSIPLIFFVVILIIPILFIKNKLKLNYISLILYLIFFSFAFFHLIFISDYSVKSIMYLFFIYFPFIFSIKMDDMNKIKKIYILQNMIFITSILGISQFILQLIGFGYIDPISNIPKEFLVSGYNTTYTLSYTSSIFKPNGLFYLEPSFFSQFSAISIIIELYYFKRLKRIIILFTSLIFSFSGTGLLILLIFSIPIFLKLEVLKKLEFIVLILLVSGIFVSSGYSSYTSSRFSEVNSSKSSFSIRFVNPIKSVLNQNFNSILFGNGPGKCDKDELELISNFTVLTKLSYEYGLILMAIFACFIINSVVRNKNVLTYSVFFMYLFLSGSLLQPQTVFVLYLAGNIDCKKFNEKICLYNYAH